uniref:Uncharacterized LOC100184201 n=1 Tax=Ciona intestinalis TaxID=7719 RepID=F6UMG3_CIOIN|nr:uncharacterized protein LOC100184201 [Ciona intestinalis]|eukprot:XP_002130517.1 uncharacterized protein LOC100184201 [Ciona intestinalis]
MESIQKILLPLVFMLAFSARFVPLVESSCSIAMDCVDTTTNITHRSGDIWETENCERCTCWARQILLKTCLVIDDGPTLGDDYSFSPKFRKSSVFTVRLVSETAIKRRQNTPEIVVVPMEEANSFVCPDLQNTQENSGSFLIPRFKTVKYVMEVNGMGCCTMYGYPVNVHPECESVWVKDACRFDVLLRNSTTRCPHPSAFVGK